MRTMVDPWEVASADTARTTTTTLYDLVAAVQNAVGPRDGALVVPTLLHLLRSGHATWHADVKVFCEVASF